MVKRLLDVVAASVGLMVSGPLMVVVAVMIRAIMGSPVLFRQRRPGLHGRIFTVLNFRTMSVDRDRERQSQFDAHRVMPLGRILRHTSLDELPQLFNVLRGDMSLVGPRPLLMEYLNEYTPEQHRRHNGLPGITGWVQANGRKALTWEQKFALALRCFDHRSLWLDCKILLMTPLVDPETGGRHLPGGSILGRSFQVTSP